MQTLSISNAFVVIMGLSIVFIGLICIIILCNLVSLLINAFGGSTTKPAAAVTSIPESSTASDTIENRQEILAAVSAAIAEDLGTDVSAIRIHSFKKL